MERLVSYPSHTTRKSGTAGLNQVVSIQAWSLPTLLTDCIFRHTQLHKGNTSFTGLQSSAPEQLVTWVIFTRPLLSLWDSSTPKRYVCFRCLKLLGGGGWEIWNAVLACRPCVIFRKLVHYTIVIEHLIPGCTSWSLLLSAHTDSTSSHLRTSSPAAITMDTLKWKQTPRPTVSSQFKVKRCCWFGWTHLYCDFRKLIIREWASMRSMKGFTCFLSSLKQDF